MAYPRGRRWTEGDLRSSSLLDQKTWCQVSLAAKTCLSSSWNQELFLHLYKVGLGFYSNWDNSVEWTEQDPSFCRLGFRCTILLWSSGQGWFPSLVAIVPSPSCPRKPRHCTCFQNLSRRTGAAISQPSGCSLDHPSTSHFEISAHPDLVCLFPQRISSYSVHPIILDIWKAF